MNHLCILLPHRPPFYHIRRHTKSNLDVEFVNLDSGKPKTLKFLHAIFVIVWNIRCILYQNRTISVMQHNQNGSFNNEKCKCWNTTTNFSITVNLNKSTFAAFNIVCVNNMMKKSTIESREWVRRQKLNKQSYMERDFWLLCEFY